MRQLLLSITLITAACQTELAHDLDEHEANRVASLLATEGIPAETSAEGRSGDRTWTISVPSAEAPRGRQLLRAHELPGQPEPGLAEVFDEGGLLPSAMEERAMLTRALQGELVRTLESVQGVFDARVHLSIPASHRTFAPLRQETRAPTASVLLRFRGDHPPLSNEQIRQLVAGGVDELSPDDVTVVSLGQRATNEEGHRCELAALGPFAVSPRSRQALQLWLTLSISLLALLSLALLYLGRRVRRYRRQLATARAAVAEHTEG